MKTGTHSHTPPPAARPALRVALLGLVATVTGYALLAGWLLFHLHRYENERDRAVATAVGVVVEDGIGDSEDIRVRWTDDAGRTRLQLFTVYETGRYSQGKPFPVAYDPSRTDSQGFPGDLDETAAEDDLLIPTLLAGAVAAVLCAVWVWRGLRFLLLSRRPGTTLTATVRRGPRGAATAIWLVVSASRAGKSRWQRVMWHPALDDMEDGAEVVVHGPARWTRTAVIVLPGGSRPVPLGRLRRHPPRHAPFPADRTTRLDPRDTFLPPSGRHLPVRPWWRMPAGLTALGTAVGVPVALLLTSGGPTVTAVVGYGLLLATLLPSLWALSGPQP
ncbi:hypothetical protein ACVNF4_03160 [Streptomyces sp. S6]